MVNRLFDPAALETVVAGDFNQKQKGSVGVKVNGNGPANSMMPSHTNPADVEPAFRGMPIRLEIASRILTGHFDIQAKDIDYRYFAELALKQADALIEAHNKDQGGRVR